MTQSPPPDQPAVLAIAANIAGLVLILAGVTTVLACAWAQSLLLGGAVTGAAAAAGGVYLATLREL